MKTTLFCFAAIIGMAASPGTNARPLPATAVRAVPLGDLDLDRPDHRALLRNRVRAAARDVCGALNPGAQLAIDACVAHGIETARYRPAPERVASILDAASGRD